eukprot:jgi/Bigna1/88651/estExt_fgenesh1_pg.C_350142
MWLRLKLHSCRKTLMYRVYRSYSICMKCPANIKMISEMTKMLVVALHPCTMTMTRYRLDGKARKKTALCFVLFFLFIVAAYYACEHQTNGDKSSHMSRTPPTIFRKNYGEASRPQLPALDPLSVRGDDSCGNDGKYDDPADADPSVNATSSIGAKDNSVESDIEAMADEYDDDDYAATGDKHHCKNDLDPCEHINNLIQRSKKLLHSIETLGASSSSMQQYQKVQGFLKYRRWVFKELKFLERTALQMKMKKVEEEEEEDKEVENASLSFDKNQEWEHHHHNQQQQQQQQPFKRQVLLSTNVPLECMDLYGLRDFKRRSRCRREQEEQLLQTSKSLLQCAMLHKQHCAGRRSTAPPQVVIGVLPGTISKDIKCKLINIGIARVIHIPITTTTTTITQHEDVNSTCFSPASDVDDRRDCLRNYAKELKRTHEAVSPINLDVTAVVALCSDLCHTKHKYLKQQQQQQNDDDHELTPFVEGKREERKGKGSIKVIDLLLQQHFSTTPTKATRTGNISAGAACGGVGVGVVGGAPEAAAAYVPEHIRYLADDEERSQAADIIMKAIEGKKGHVFICESAMNCIEKIFAAVGGTEERKRLKNLLQNERFAIKIIKNKKSDRISSIQSKKLRKETRQIFSTGDSIGAITITSNAAFLRSARQAGVHLKALLHPARALVGHIVMKAAADSQAAATTSINNAKT